VTQTPQDQYDGPMEDLPPPQGPPSNEKGHEQPSPEGGSHYGE